MIELIMAQNSNPFVFLIQKSNKNVFLFLFDSCAKLLILKRCIFMNKPHFPNCFSEFFNYIYLRQHDHIPVILSRLVFVQDIFATNSYSSYIKKILEK
jgi:hypothetical protein